MRPIGDEVFADQEDDHLRGERQGRERPMAVLVEGDQAVGRRDAKQHGGAGDQQADAEIARHAPE